MDEMLATAPCGFLSFADDGRILAINQTLCEMLEMAEGEALAARIESLLSPGSRVFYQTHFFPILKLHGSASEIYLLLRERGPRGVPVLVNAKRTERGGETVNDVVFFRIRERSLFEEELLQAKRTAERASAAKDQFLAALSHELRTPLTPVLMIAASLEGEPGLSSEVRAQIAAIRRNAELEVRLIDDLLDVTRITHGKMRLNVTETDAHELLAHTATLMEEEARAKRIEVHLAYGADNPFVRGDPTRLQQVFWNLFRNAIKFTPTGGRVIVRTGSTGDGMLWVEVRDTGIGIEDAALARIFSAFEQGTLQEQRQFGGLGLGLAISKGIVAMHGGTIRAESEGAGRGAAFIVELPGITRPTARQDQAPEKMEREGRLRILLVEDHESTRQVMARILGRAGHEIAEAGNVESALSAASQGRFDVVISDLGLPDRSGLELMRELKTRYAVPGIALSGYGMEEDIASAVQAGFCAHLVKPVHIEDLHGLLERIAAGTLP